MSRILVMTDSTSDIPPNLVARFDIRVVPTYIQFGQESLADDGVELTRSDFYTRLVTSPVHPTTSAPPRTASHPATNSSGLAVLNSNMS